MIRSALIVCTGNICRSPMAEALLAKSLEGLLVSSAGTHALVDAPAEKFAQEVMAARGMDISYHRGRQVTASMLGEVDVVLVMESAHRQYLAHNFRSVLGKTFRLCEASIGDVPDPYRGSREDFLVTFEQIQKGVEAWANSIRRLN